jgi:uncharacterized phage protein gp47/JayE
MTVSINDVVSQMRASLAVTDPDLDTSAGTTTRKIMDAVSESFVEAYLDQHMLAYAYDIDTKIEGDLDSFTQTVGGIARLAAKRATGTVTFTRIPGAAAELVFIPVNSEIDANIDLTTSVQTIVGAIMEIGQTSITVPCQTVVAGPQGNLPAGSLTRFGSPISGVGTVTNMQALTGGMLQETDDELRARWKATAFRSLAGTEGMYLGCALNDESCTAATVLGASKRRREQVQVNGGIAISQVEEVAFTFPSAVFVGADIDSGVFLIKDIDYTWDNLSNPPRIVIETGVTTYDTGLVDDAGLPIRALIEGSLLDLDFEYTPKSSRNDPTNDIVFRVDIWCAGERSVEATQSVLFRSTLRFTAPLTDPYPLTQFVHPNGSHPSDGNIFIPLAFGPIITVPDILTVAGSTYGRVDSGVVADHPNAYSVVHDNSSWGYSATSLFGLEWVSTLLPPTNSVFTLGGNGGYNYNEVPRAIQDQIDRWRLVSKDAKVHAAKQVYLRFALVVMYARSANQSEVSEAVDVALATHLSSLGLGGVVQTSDILRAVTNVSGIDAARFLVPSDIPSMDGYTYATANNFVLGIQEIVAGVVTKTWVNAGGALLDPMYGDNEVPVFNQSIKSVRAQNTYGARA